MGQENANCFGSLLNLTPKANGLRSLLFGGVAQAGGNGWASGASAGCSARANAGARGAAAASTTVALSVWSCAG